MALSPTETSYLGNAGVGMQFVAALSSMVGAYQGAQARKEQYRFDGEMAGINAQASERAAQAALLAGQREEQRSSIATANLKSTQQVGFAANGIDLGEGSALHTLTSTDVFGAIDKNTIAANAIRGAWGYRTQTTNYQNEALQRRTAAGAISPTAAGAASLLTSASAVAGNWYSMNKAGIN